MIEAKSKSERQVRRGRPPISDATRELVVQLYNDDKPCRWIAEACNISEASVFRIIREARR